MTDGETLAGVILAGGLSRRMGGGDKTLETLRGSPMLAHVIERARPQVDALVLNVNGDPARFAPFGLPTVADPVEGFAGPLAGILAGMAWAEEAAPGARWLASFAADAPFFPTDLVARLLAAARSAGLPLACAASGGRTHPVFGVWRLDLRQDLDRSVAAEGMRKIDQWTARHGVAVVDYPAAPMDPFFNVNRRQDLARAEQLLHGGV